MNFSSISLQNFRRFREKSTVEFKPLTILLGKNSSGKSSILRTIPLIKQSIDSPTSISIINWNGSLVEFGGASIARSHTTPTNENMEITLSLDNLPLFPFTRIRRGVYTDSKTELKLIFPTSGKNSRTQTPSIEISNNVFDFNLKVSFDRPQKKASVTIEDFHLKHLFSYDDTIQTGSLLPRLYQTESSFYTFNELIRFDPSLEDYDTGDNPLFDQVVYFVQEKLKVSAKKAQKNALSIFSKIFRTMRFNNHKEHEELKRARTNNPEIFRHVYNYFLCGIVPTIFESINREMAHLSKNIVYAEPIRHTPQRDYVFQNLGLEQPDSSGNNLVEFLHYKKITSPDSFRTLNQNLQNYFGFTIDTKIRHHLLNLEIIDNKHGRCNIKDTGTGISQMLPVAVALSVKNSGLAIIEQPELHLHPEAQFQLGKFIAQSSTNKATQQSKRILIETHSKDLIYGICESIIEKKVNPENVLFLVIEPTDTTNHINHLKVDENGVILNWPIGFLDPE